MDRPNLLSQLSLGNVTLNGSKTAEERFITDLIDAATRADSSRTGWLEEMRRLTRLRFGLRAPKSFPWPGCSNISIPLIDPIIRRMKPLLMRLIVQPDPIVEFVGEDSAAVEAERTAEQEFNWLFKSHMNAVEPCAYVVDSILHRGIGFFHLAWDYRTEYSCRVIDSAAFMKRFAGQKIESPDPIIAELAKEYDLNSADPRIAASLTKAATQLIRGEPSVKLAFKSVIVDRPALWDREPVQIIAPTRTSDYGDAEFIIVQHLTSARKLRQMAADGYFSKAAVEKILDNLSADTHSQLDTIADNGATMGLSNEQAQNDEREKIMGDEDFDNILVWQAYCWTDLDNDGLLDRTEVWIHPGTKTKLRAAPYVLPINRWPVFKLDFEKTSRRFHAPRGIAAMTEGMQRAINNIHNARLDAMTIRNAPMYQAPALAGFKARQWKIQPGSIVEVPPGASIQPIQHDHSPFGEQVNEENLLRQVAETYIGSFDNALAGGAGDRRTATEVNAATQLAASVATMDTILFQLGMKEVYTAIWAVWMDLRPDYVSYKLHGVDPSTNEPVLVTVPKSDVAKKFKLFPTGTIANTSKSLELSNAREAVQFFTNDQSGFINPFELRKWYLDLIDPRRARRVLNTPDQAQELTTLRQAAAALQQDPSLAAAAGAPGAANAPAQPDQTEFTQTPDSQV